MGDLKLKKHTNKLLILAIVLSIIPIPGIPMIVVGAIKHHWIMMSFGILFGLSAFYGCPLAWVFYAEDKKLARFISAIRGGCFSIDRLSQEFKMPKTATKNAVRKLIDNRYLLGYSFPNDKMLIEHKPRVSYEKCPECGAGVNVIGWTSLCPYCHAVVKNTHPFKEFTIEINAERFNLIKDKKQKILIQAALPNTQEIEVSDTIILVNKSTNEKLAAYLEELLMASSIKKIVKQKPIIDFGYNKSSIKKINKDITRYDVNPNDECKYGVIGLCLEIKD